MWGHRVKALRTYPQHREATGGFLSAYSAFVGLDREKKTAVAITVNYGLVDTKTLAFSIFEQL